ncbi:hypothetical protein JCM5353_000305 [Sporobolomyces roseus]
MTTTPKFPRAAVPSRVSPTTKFELPVLSNDPSSFGRFVTTAIPQFDGDDIPKQQEDFDYEIVPFKLRKNEKLYRGDEPLYCLRRVSDAKLVFTFHRNSSTNHILAIYCTASASDLVLVEVGWKKVLRAHSIVTLEVSKTDTCDNLILPSPGSNEMPPQLSRNLFSTLTALRSAFPTCPDVVAQYLDGTAEPTRKKRKLAGTDWPLAAPAAKILIAKVKKNNFVDFSFLDTWSTGQALAIPAGVLASLPSLKRRYLQRRVEFNKHVVIMERGNFVLIQDDQAVR